jgi:hypothetical protein
MRLLPFSFLLLVSCASLRSVSLTSIPKERENKVTASVSKWVILGINFDNDYVEGLTSKLRSDCKGKVTGILTTYQATSYLFVSKHEITAAGFCGNQGSKSAARASEGPSVEIQL